jgi:hypothetical protein
MKMARRAAAALLVAGLTVFYYAAASQHARTVNLSKARGDQSGYLWDAQQVYWNWHGRTPTVLVGERNRMPLYAGYLALFYSPEISDDDYFVVAKRWNIRLSLVLLAALAVIFARQLPPLVAANLIGVVAFGYFVFKAGYAQSELLFYFLFFLTFLAFWQLLCRPERPARMRLACAAGTLAALAHLTKAGLLPFVALFVGVFVVFAWIRTARHGTSSLLREAAVPVVVVVAFLAVLSPYLVNSKRTFGHYFYNVNTTFYAWYDNWAQASLGTIRHGDGVGWPDLPPDQIPSASKYWQSHTAGQIAARVAGGFKDMVVRSYRTYGYLKYVAWYIALLALVILSNTTVFASLVRRNAPLVSFLALYGISHVLLIAFYEPISGTGTTRFLIAHLTPFFYAASRYLTHPEVVRTTKWRIGTLTVGVGHLAMLTSAVLALDVAILIWPRVMTTYGGF